MKKLAIAVALVLALCGSLLCSPVEAKTFVGVLWPMFGPLPAIGLVELVAELKAMPDVEVETYVHQAWPSLVEDLKHLPPGTHTIVVGYSLGANSSVFVANNSKYIDTIVALQPSMLSWNPDVTGKVGHYIEIYNPNPWETFGGMGSKKLIGPNIDYIANNDSHPGAQFDPQFRDLVKSEVAKLVAQDREPDRVETARADTPKPVDVAAVERQDTGQIIDLHPNAEAAARAPLSRPLVEAERGPAPSTQADVPQLPPVTIEQVADERPQYRPGERALFLDTLTGSVQSGDLLAERQLTAAEMMEYAKRTYGVSHSAAIAPGNRQAQDSGSISSGLITTASVAFDRTALAGQ